MPLGVPGTLCCESTKVQQAALLGPCRMGADTAPLEDLRLQSSPKDSDCWEEGAQDVMCPRPCRSFSSIYLVSFCSWTGEEDI